MSFVIHKFMKELKLISTMSLVLVLLSACSSSYQDSESKDYVLEEQVNSNDVMKNKTELTNDYGEESISTELSEAKTVEENAEDLDEKDDLLSYGNAMYSIGYLSDFDLTEIVTGSTHLVLRSKNYKSASSDGRLDVVPPRYGDNIEEGAEIIVSDGFIREDWYGWDHFGMSETMYLGKRISAKETTMGKNKVFKRVREGLLCITNCDEPGLKVHRMTYIVIPNKSRDRVVNFVMTSQADVHDEYLSRYEDIVSSFEWVE